MDYKKLVDDLNKWNENLISELCADDVLTCDDFCNCMENCIVVQASNAITDLMEQLAKVTAERDAAISDLYEARSCKTCALLFTVDCLLEECFDPCSAVLCKNTPYKWRGIQEVRDDEQL